MNVYDFDGTIYGGDSTIDFYLYALKCQPGLLRFMPRQLCGFASYGLKRIDKRKLKEYFFSFLPAIDAMALTERFWDQNQKKIYDWYLKQQKPDDVVISASPEFLLRPICQRLGVGCLVASEVDPTSGMFLGENCHGQEKVRRLEMKYRTVQISCFYSDSLSDLPLAKMADKAFLVKKGTIFEWKEIHRHERGSCI